MLLSQRCALKKIPQLNFSGTKCRFSSLTGTEAHFHAEFWSLIRHVFRKSDRLLARLFHAFCVLFPAFGGGQAVSLRERASDAD